MKTGKHNKLYGDYFKRYYQRYNPYYKYFTFRDFINRYTVRGICNSTNE